MAQKQLNIFLSASIPMLGRDEKYFKDGKRQLLSLEERQHFLYQARLRFSAPSHSRIKSDRFFL